MGIGVVAQSITTSIFGTTAGTSLNWALLAVTKGAMHGAAQGFIQGVSGGNAGQSFITAMATSIVGDAFGAIDGAVGKLTNTIVGQSLFGAVAGGLTSHFQGGNFWEGATIGLTVGLLNHAGKKLYPAIDGLLNPKPKVNYKKFFTKMLTRFNANLPTVDMVYSGIAHYYDGFGQPAQLGPKSINALFSNKDYIRVRNALVTGAAQSLTNTFDVNLTDTAAFIVGRTNVDYSTVCNSANCTTTFSAFVRDSFSDPLGLGIEWYSGGPGGGANPHPYNFIPLIFTVQYANPGYSINR